MNEPRGRAPGILLVDDNPADVRLMREALEGGLPKRIFAAGDGAEAVRLLCGGGVPLPDLILLDLNLPGISGFEVLDQIRRRDWLRLIPVIIFSSSSAAEDVRKAYSSHANCYVTKPGNLDEFFLAIHRIADFWLDTARLPDAQPDAPRKESFP